MSTEVNNKMTDTKITLAGDLGKPANTFIEKISDAVGGIAKPYQIIRVAKAEVQAAKIRALGDIEIQELQERALIRFAVEETNKQANMESIAYKALAGLTEDAQPDQMEDDWITDFFDKCRLVSDDDMQNLWAKILAGEANEVGSYSKRVVAAVSTLSKSEAELFNTLCSFGWTIEQLTPLIYDIQSDIYQNHGVTFTVLLDFEAIGLISMSGHGFGHTNASQEFGPSYHGESVDLLLPPEEHGYHMNTGIVLLTGAGLELATVCNLRPIDGFKDYILDHWKQLGYTIVGDD